MPGFDGTGPLGRGPMTGRGMGYCALSMPQFPVSAYPGGYGTSGYVPGPYNSGSYPRATAPYYGPIPAPFVRRRGMGRGRAWGRGRGRGWW